VKALFGSLGFDNWAGAAEWLGAAAKRRHHRLKTYRAALSPSSCACNFASNSVRLPREEMKALIMAVDFARFDRRLAHRRSHGEKRPLMLTPLSPI
jgi:hypothetical protein